MGMFFNAFFRHADVVKMANLAQMVNVIAPIMTNKKACSCSRSTSRWRSTPAAREHGAGRLGLSRPTYKIRTGAGGSTYLDVSATYKPQSTRGRSSMC